MVLGCLRGASQHLTEGVQSSRGGRGVGGNGGGKPLPLPLPMGCGGIPEGVKGATGLAGLGGEVCGIAGIGGKRPLPLPLHVERPPGLGIKISSA